MPISLSSLPKGTIVYPDSDGKPMADNTKQAHWIILFFDNLCALFAQLADVFVAADHLWYPVEGENRICLAPDVYVVFGRPKGHRGSYRQWEEENVPLTVAIEVLSPKNTYKEMADKLYFYDTYGVEEYYVYDPEENTLEIYLRKGTVLRRVQEVDGFVSPRMGIRFQMTMPEMTVHNPDGSPFLPFVEVAAHRARAKRDAEQAEDARRLAEDARHQADLRATQADLRATQAEDARHQADLRATQADLRATQAEGEVERLRRLLEQATPSPPSS